MVPVSRVVRIRVTCAWYYRYMDVPEDYLAKEPRYMGECLKRANVWISQIKNRSRFIAA